MLFSVSFDEYTAYFMHEQNKEAMAEETMQDRAKEFQDSWASPNWSKFGYGWRGKVLHRPATRNLNYHVLTWYGRDSFDVYEMEKMITSTRRTNLMHSKIFDSITNFLLRNDAL